MKDRNKLIIAIVAVVAIVAIVGGATFAYWTWVTSDEQQTQVSFTVTGPNLSAHIEGNGTTDVTSLKPATCDSSNAIKKTVTINYMNETTQSATVSATLQTTAFGLRNASYVPTPANLTNLKYALTTTSGSCSTNVATDLNGNQITGDFSALTFNGATASNLPLTLFTQTFTAPANMSEEATQTYYLWIWLDKAYEHENVGDNNSDPMQGLTFTTQWSGIIAQNES